MQTVLWTNSTIVLHWIKKLPCTLRTFVANCVASIQETTSDCFWCHLPSVYNPNPADIASRGYIADELTKSKLWWEGPLWLKKAERFWPQEGKCARISEPERNIWYDVKRNPFLQA